MEPISFLELIAYAVGFVLVAVAVFALRHVLVRGVPDLSAQAVGLLRIAFGLALYEGLTRLELPDAAAPGGAGDEAGLWQPWGWVEYLAGHWNVRDALFLMTYLAVAAFTVGLLTRLAYVAVVVGYVVRLLVAQEYGVGSHAWVILPLVLAPLVVVRWGDALSVDAWVRRRRGLPSTERPPGPGYGLAVWLPGLTLGCAWLAAGYAKLHASGIAWVTSGAVRYHWAEDFLNAKVDWGGWVAGHEAVAVFLSACGVGIELLFITHVLVRNQWVRLLYGLVGASLLSGFFLFQGVLWYAWWLIPLFFLPWQAITDLLARWIPALRPGPRVAAFNRLGLALLGRISPMVAAVVAFVVVQQAVMSRERVEQMPFFSNYPMYSYTQESPEAFNTNLAPIKFYRYRVMVEGKGDVTDRLTDNEVGYLRDALISRLRHGDEPLGEAEREGLSTVRAAYQERYGQDLPRVRILTVARVFDFSGGGLTTKGAPDVPPVEIDLEAFETRRGLGAAFRDAVHLEEARDRWEQFRSIGR